MHASNSFTSSYVRDGSNDFNKSSPSSMDRHSDRSKSAASKTSRIFASTLGNSFLVFFTRDIDEMPDYLNEGMEVRFAKDYQKVYDVAFG